MTPLDEAARNGHKEMVALLIDAGADYNQFKESPLYHASKHGHVDVVEVLLAKKAKVTSEGKDNLTPLEIAIKNGHESVFFYETLLASGIIVKLNFWRQLGVFVNLCEIRNHLESVNNIHIFIFYTLYKSDRSVYSRKITSYCSWLFNVLLGQLPRQLCRVISGRIL